MSPLWSEQALARAAWAKAVEKGLVDESVVKETKTALQQVRRLPHRRLHSFAL